jgi:hypothetical protein
VAAIEEALVEVEVVFVVESTSLPELSLPDSFKRGDFLIDC